MNRIVIVGNGFDLAHGLKTSYKDFIGWYWEQKLNPVHDTKLQDKLCTLITPKRLDWYMFLWEHAGFSIHTPKEYVEHIFNEENGFTKEATPFFGTLIQSIETKGWVDIENEYYLFLKGLLGNSKYKNPEELNEELDFIKDKLIQYLNQINCNEINDQIINDNIKRLIFEPFKERDIAISSKSKWRNFIQQRILNDDASWRSLLYCYSIIDRTKQDEIIKKKSRTPESRLPDNIYILNFNYTSTADLYLPKNSMFETNHIHGTISNPNSVIFGYGDELDPEYKRLLDLNDNSYLSNIKSIKYLESLNYRRLLSYIESDDFQIYIMGHSCGNSDRTLLNTLFEHPNCVSIKPFYYKRVDGTDNYTEIIQNISRNFKDMKLMRDRVVNKAYCEPFSVEESITINK